MDVVEARSCDGNSGLSGEAAFNERRKSGVLELLSNFMRFSANLLRQKKSDIRREIAVVRILGSFDQDVFDGGLRRNLAHTILPDCLEELFRVAHERAQL